MLSACDLIPMSFIFTSICKNVVSDVSNLRCLPKQKEPSYKNIQVAPLIAGNYKLQLSAHRLRVLSFEYPFYLM